MFARISFALPFIFLTTLSFAQTSQQGVVAGSILDSQSGRPIAGATVAIDGHSDRNNVTGADGQFRIPLAPGTYVLRVTAESYATAEVTDVIVKAGEIAEASTVLSSKSLVTSIEVVEKVGVVDATAEAMLSERKLSAVVSDSISKEELSSGTSGDAAGALQKVTGVSVVGAGFVYVRGLGERYSATQLNGAVVPTTEPEKRVVPLDLFPTGMIENIKIAKTYSPDLPAEFSGGLVQLKTVDFPLQRIFNVSLKTGFNTATTFNRFLSSPGGASDFFGFGSGSRELPSSIPTNARLFAGQFTRDQLQGFGQAFSDNWEPTVNGSARPALDWSAVAGGTFGRFGLIGALSVSNKLQQQSELQRYIRQGGNAPVIFTNYPDYHEYSESARMGAIFNAAIKLDSNNKLVLRNTFTHDADKTAREFSGYDGGVDSDLNAQRLRYIERTVYSSGVEGDHSLPRLHNSLIHWQLTYSLSGRNEPDLREVIRNRLPDGRYIFSASGSSGLRFFSDLNDKIYEPQVDYSVPFFKGIVSGLFKTGFRMTSRRRDFEARRFLFAPQQVTSLNLFLPSNQLFAPTNIRPTGFQITEFTRATDTYSAQMDVFAGYGMVDLSLGRRWRFEGGVRIEDADQRVTTFDNRVPNAKPVIAGLQNRDPAPAINAIYSLSAKQNLRVSYSRTLSRPDFRELSPFDFNNVLGGFVSTGNPDLKRATVGNYDARWEWFPGGNQLIAASVFAKTFTNPIEQTILPSNDLRQTFVNAKAARNVGFELEFRRSLAFLSKRLKDFGVSANFTVVDSNIEIRTEDATVVTSQNRALLGQSRYIANAIVQWVKPTWRSQAKFYTNYVSRRVSDAGTFRLPDIYQEPNTFVDFVYTYNFTERGKYSLRFEAENLANTQYRWTQGQFVQRLYQTGRNFTVGFHYSFF
ncbi:MAG: TonB-dependent receptor [Acidobacteria bacterium]|nr:TonB-dependent receptor [Acidobacteriota bacterium]